MRVGGTAREKGGCLEYRPIHSAGQGGTSLTKHRLVQTASRGSWRARSTKGGRAEGHGNAGDNDARRGYAIADGD